MSLERSVLLVSPTAFLSRTLGQAIRRAGYRLLTSTTFESARLQLDTVPDLLITELKLGEYNGLQLALRGRAMGVPAIVVADGSFEQEIERLGAIWLSADHVDGDDIQTVIAGVLQNMPSTSYTLDWFNTASEDAIVDRRPMEWRSRHVH